MGTQEYRKLSNSRAGVEGIPSVLRRRYRVDEMPIRGLVRSKIWFGFKIAAMNFKSLVNGCQKSTKEFCTPFYLIIYSKYLSTKKLFLENHLPYFGFFEKYSVLFVV
jgi:hypothetical protein